MSLKQEICRAFCEGVTISPFADGFAISTPYLDRFGDRIGMYAVRQPNATFKIIDNALTIARLEAEGASVSDGTRREVFYRLLQEHGAEFDEEFGEVFKPGVDELSLPRAVLDFSSLLMRLADLLFLTRDRVESTFKEDVKALLHQALDNRAILVEDEPVSAELSEITPDIVIRPIAGGVPVAVFMVTAEPKLWQAIHLRLIANYEHHQPLSIVAMLESEETVPKRIRVQADNRLDAVPRFNDGPKDAIQRVVRTVLGPTAAVH